VEKTCFKCGQPKPVEDFYKHPQMADGRLNKCKECTKSNVHANYVTHIDEKRSYERERFQQPERKSYVLAAGVKHRERHPERYKARVAVNNAVRDGRLVKKPCEGCGSEKVQAHHEDYSKPLDVKWLCFVCHRRHHGQDPAPTDRTP